jgi:hypothetical protein
VLITNPICPSFSIYLSGGNGHVFGEIVGGEIKVATVDLISAILLRKPKFHRLVKINVIFLKLKCMLNPIPTTTTMSLMFQTSMYCVLIQFNSIELPNILSSSSY